MSGQLEHHIVGIQHCCGGCFRNSFSAKSQNVTEGTDNNQEIGREAADISNGMSSGFFRERAVCLFVNTKSREELCQEIFAGNRLASRSTSAREEWRMFYADSDALHQSPCHPGG